jgi:GTP-binding protein SAR1
VSILEEEVKIIISGLDYAGKSSMLIALDKKFDFRKEIMELKPTIRVNYNSWTFLGKNIHLWDMGGQEKYRDHYKEKEDIYFADTNLIIYMIDVQDKVRFKPSLEYLDAILQYFMKNNMEVPIIIAFNKFDPDPELRGNEEIMEDISELKETISEKYSQLKVLFQMTSVFDILSIIQLMSYSFSVFHENFLELSELFEKYVEELNCMSLIMFDSQGIIITEYYSYEIDTNLYIELLETIKEHLFILKRIQEEKYDAEHNFFSIENQLLSYLHKIKLDSESFYISVTIKEDLKEKLLNRFSDFLEDLNKVFEHIIS